MKKRRILVIGSGGREHALVWHLKRFDYEVFCAPGSDAIREMAATFSFNHFSDLVEQIRSYEIDEVIVGPEKFLAEGIANHLQAAGISVFGPTQEAALLETDKAWAKDFCVKYKLPTARAITVTSSDELEKALNQFQAPFVVKASGLAQGKGVWIGDSKAEALTFGQSALRDHRSLVVEEFLNGEEISYFVLVDGDRSISLGGAQDHKRLLENDLGPNTGGMGAYSPLPLLTPELDARIQSEVVAPCLRALEAEKLHYRGFIFFGLMIVNGNPLLLEFNCRLGDPETQALMLRLESPLPELIHSLSTKPLTARLSRDIALNIVLAANGYPDKPKSGFILGGIERAPEGITVFHSGTRKQSGGYHAVGGRLISVATTASSLFEAQQKVYPWIESLPFLKNITYRRDIGVRAYIHLTKENHA